MSKASSTFEKTQLRRVVLSSFLGSTLEYYDFLLYGTLSALVFGQVFFSDLDPVVGIIASFGTFAAGYLARPLGGIIFGHFGDRIGRKAMLFWSLTLMAGASILIGLVPGYDTIGVAAPIMLVVLRIVQGTAIGGEWGGSVLMSAEHAKSKRGLWASFTPAGAPVGSLLSTFAITTVSALTTEEQFMSWGWRLPFLASALLLVIGLVVRFKIVESPVFAAAIEGVPERSRVPLFDVLRTQWRRVLLAIGIAAGIFVSSSLLTVFLVSYSTTNGFERQELLNILTFVSAVAVFTTIGAGLLSDRIGRRPTMIGGAIAVTIATFLVFPAVDSGSVLLLGLAMFLHNAVAHPFWNGPAPSLLAELFPTKNRYTGASVSFQFAGIGGGVAPLIFASIIGSGGSPLIIAFIMSGMALIAVVCLFFATETSTQSLGDRSEASVESSTARG